MSNELKNFTEFCFEAVTPEEIQEKAPKVAEELKREISKILPNHVVKVRFSKSLGRSIDITVYGENPTNGISHNSNSFMSIIMHLSDNFGRETELSKVAFEKTNFDAALKDFGVRFRKISDKTLEGAAKKLVRWFKKNKDGIEQAEATNGKIR